MSFVIVIISVAVMVLLHDKKLGSECMREPFLLGIYWIAPLPPSAPGLFSKQPARAAGQKSPEWLHLNKNVVDFASCAV
jgi:hypothetical protein